MTSFSTVINTDDISSISTHIFNRFYQIKPYGSIRSLVLRIMSHRRKIVFVSMLNIIHLFIECFYQLLEKKISIKKYNELFAGKCVLDLTCGDGHYTRK